MVFAGWYALIVGVLMIVQWAFFILTGQGPELQSEPLRIAFHLAAEGVTAALLIIAGAALLRSRRWARSVGLVALGSLVYTSIVSPGYFAQLGQWPLVTMFAALLASAVACIVALMRIDASPGAALERDRAK
jgi:CHASE2 domain-containing sensor protein